GGRFGLQGGVAVEQHPVARSAPVAHAPTLPATTVVETLTAGALGWCVWGVTASGIGRDADACADRRRTRDGEPVAPPRNGQPRAMSGPRPHGTPSDHPHEVTHD